ncbi:hypothetical protein K439DRAFT_333044 [Ramaria rubella]|nr:hypothetical protein K439DRAFT_333044 [Ramaria rubella]
MDCFWTLTRNTTKNHKHTALPDPTPYAHAAPHTTSRYCACVFLFCMRWSRSAAVQGLNIYVEAAALPASPLHRTSYGICTSVSMVPLTA